jgi:hypothetical protein
MPSINLLPENFTIEAYKKREKAAVYVLAVVFLVASTTLSAWAEVSKQQKEKESLVLDGEINSVKQEIQYNVDSSSLLSSDYSKNDITKMLKDHAYLSKAMKFMKEVIVKEAYINSLNVYADKSGDSVIEAHIIARDDDVIANQLAVLKDSFWVRSASLGEVKTEKDTGVSTDVTLTVRKDLLLFHEQYYDFALDTLSGVYNRYIDIGSYTVATKTDKNEASGATEETVVVNFTGSAYDGAKLDEFEKRLNDMNDIVKEITINKFTSPSDKPGIVSFRGSLTLKH